MERKRISKYHSKVGVMLECPKCGYKWRPGQFNWYAYQCDKCHKMIPKTDWLIFVPKKPKPIKKIKHSLCNRMTKTYVGNAIVCPHCHQAYMAKYFDQIPIRCEKCERRIKKSQWLIADIKEK